MSVITSVERFNSVMLEFLTELADVFSDEPSFYHALENFKELVSINFKKPREMFVETIVPFSDKIVSRSDSFFDSIDFPGVDMKKLWHSDISEDTRDAIWKYMTALLVSL
jgi:hypothetical protein